MRRTSSLSSLAPILALILLPLALSGCPGRRGSQGNIVLITIESLRADRLTGPVPAVDPFENLRAASTSGTMRRVLASSSESLPSLVSVFTGHSPARHGVLVEGFDRVPPSLPTLAQKLEEAGFRTGGFPSLAAQGLASGLSRGFQAYGWPPADLVAAQTTTAGTNGQGWVLEAGRRPGQATVADALEWVRRHRAEKLFLWVHLSEATPPYATDRALIEAYRGSMYDASMAYEDRCVKALMNGFQEIGLLDRTTFLVAGNHGESLGAHGESFHGLNLYPPALETIVAIVPPAGKGSAGKGDKGAGSPTPDAPGRLQDLYATVLDLAGISVPPGTDAATGLPSISRDRPLLSVTLGPRSAFGWPGRVSLFDGEWMWTGPQEEEVFKLGEDPAGAPTAEEATIASSLRQRAEKEAEPIAGRLAGRPSAPPAAARMRVVDLLRSAAAAREQRSREGELGALREAWSLDPGNYEVGIWLTLAGGPHAPDRAAFARDVEARGAGMPESLLAMAKIAGVAEGAGGVSLEGLKRACASSGDGCAVDLALRLSRAGRHEEASKVLSPVAEKANEVDLWRTLGDLYFAVENTYRAGQAFDKAAALRPADPDIILRQGDCLAALRDFKGAKEKYESARAAQPDLNQVEIRLGRLARQQGDRAAAVEHFRKGIGADTNTTAGSIALGRVLSEQGMTTEAIPLFQDAAARDTSSGEALYYAGEALASEGKLDEAEKALRSALERSPSNPIMLYTLARLVAYRGDRATAGSLLEQLARTDSVDTAIAALRDPLFTNDAPEAPLAKGLQALYEVVKRSQGKPEGVMAVGDPTAAPQNHSPPSRP